MQPFEQFITDHVVGLIIKINARSPPTFLDT